MCVRQPYICIYQCDIYPESQTKDNYETIVYVFRILMKFL